MQKFIVNIDNAGARLDKFLAKNGFGFVLAQKLLRQKDVKVNGGREKADHRLQEGDLVEVFGDVKITKQMQNVPKVSEEKINLIKKSIIYQDENLLAIDKPAGVAVQAGLLSAFSIDSILPYLKLEQEETPRLVHRLDRDTSGILLLARNRRSAALLSEGFKNKTISKTYLALVSGVPSKDVGVISIPLLEKTFGLGQKSTKKVFRDDALGKEAVTHYKVLENFGDYSLLELKPITGRMHQLRVHCKEIGHPIIGDGKYGRQLVGNVANGVHSLLFRGDNGCLSVSENRVRGVHSPLFRGDNGCLSVSENRVRGVHKSRMCLHSWKIEIADFFGRKLEIVSKKPDFI